MNITGCTGKGAEATTLSPHSVAFLVGSFRGDRDSVPKYVSLVPPAEGGV